AFRPRPDGCSQDWPHPAAADPAPASLVGAADARGAAGADVCSRPGRGLAQARPMKAEPPPLRPARLRRSWMFVPGLDEVAQRRGLESGADVLVADLEEFTAPADRPAARQRIVALFKLCRARGTVAAVRINTLAGDGLADLRGIMPGAPDAILLPHAENAEQIRALDEAIAACEAEFGLAAGRTEIVPTLES